MSEIVKVQDSVTIIPDTDIIASQYQGLQKELHDLIKDGEKKLIIDLKNIDIIDSAGLGVFISAQNSLKVSGGLLEVVNASKYIMKLFTIMRLDKHFSVSEKKEE